MPREPNHERTNTRTSRSTAEGLARAKRLRREALAGCLPVGQVPCEGCGAGVPRGAEACPSCGQARRVSDEEQ